MQEATVAAQAAAALDAVIHIRRGGARRYISQIAVLERRRGELYTEIAVEVQGQDIEFTPAFCRLAERFSLEKD